MAVASAERFGDREAIVEEGGRVSFSELAGEMRLAAGALIGAGLQRGDRAAIWAPNSAEWIVWALGILAAGGILVPVNTRFKAPEARYILERSRARLLITVGTFLGTDYAGMAADELARLPALERVVVHSDRRPPRTESWNDLVHAGEAVGSEVVDARIAAILTTDVSDIIFTSGTTGRPKGVVLTHGQSLEVYRSWTDLVGLREGDRYLIVYPFFHCAGYKAGWMSALMRGATVVPHAVYDPEAVLKRAELERITVLPGPPTVLQELLDANQVGNYDLSSLRLTITGAASIPVELVRRLGAEMTFERVITGYGLTETCGTVAMCRHDDDPETVANWSGRALPGTELAVVDEGGHALPPGSPGEVVTRGYHVMSGYFEDPDQTAAVIDSSGWLHTGDVGVMDEGGYVRITDRLGDMFIVGGFNAYPAEIEGMILAHKGVSQACVVGVPDERLGEVGAAFVVARPGHTLDPDELVEWCRREMANYKVPRYVTIVDSLPKNATGKVQKDRLRERAAKGFKQA